jgi:ABC-2 type transport system ATP-binding protein
VLPVADGPAGPAGGSTSGSLAVEARSLTRAFKQVNAVDGLDLAIRRGDLFGLVGPDGAGKTTTLRLLAGLLSVTSGAATVLGYDLEHEAESVKPHTGYMAQQFSLYAELSVAENLRFFGQIFDVSDAEIAARQRRLLAFAGLEAFRSRRAGHLSGGMQKKLALACTLIHRPDLLLLDEPTTGVDPVSRREFWDILTDLHLQGTTIVVSTPYMDEADRCSTVGLIYRGRLMVCDTPQRIRAPLAGRLIELIPDDWREARQVVASLPGIREVQTYGESLHLVVDSAADRLPQVEQALRDHNLTYRGARLAPARMEEAFISLIREKEAS